MKWADAGWRTTTTWKTKNGCDAIGAIPTSAFPGDSTTGSPPPPQAYSGCTAGYPVTLCLHAYSDQPDAAHAFPVQWGAKGATDFFLALPPAP